MLLKKSSIKKNSICNQYYEKVIENFKKKNIFYTYKHKKYSYQYASLKLKRYLAFFSKFSSEKKLNIVVYCEKSLDLYVLIQSIFLSNAVFIPISKNTPANRILSMLSEIKVDYFIYDNFENKNIYNIIKKKFVTKNINQLNKKKEKELKIKNWISDYNNTCMIYFTSGSTGIPKGTKISHFNYITDFFLQKKNLYKNIQKKLVFGDYHETSFSIFFDIYFPAIFFGSTIAPAKTFHEKTEIIEHLKENKVNVLITVPSTIQRISTLYKKINFKNYLKIIIITGETFYLNQLKYLYQNFKFKKVFNCYGSTELSNWVFFHLCKKKDLKIFKKYNLVPIGKNFKNIFFKVKNKILHIGGDIVSQGYLKKIQNKNKFYTKSKINWYNTEDRVFRYKNVFICKGRNKNIVKIFGYRIDLSDIESNLRKIKNINEAYCMKHSNNLRESVIAFIKFFKSFDEKKVQEQLKKYLPNYMIPKKIITIKKFPLNNNGKIDRKKLFSTKVNFL